jgi:hypothetical protein
MGKRYEGGKQKERKKKKKLFMWVRSLNYSTYFIKE